ncbi:MAG TPA: hypothetical protein GXX29_12165 [Firmicutes bacterium]|nr:hypothetical protein [Bacillota bacterium]
MAGDKNWEKVGEGQDMRRWGAVGDGIADDTEALQRAIAAGGPSLYLPQGRYKITRTLVVDLGAGRGGGEGRCLIRGAGATLVHEGEGPALHIVGHHEGTANPESVQPGTSRYEVMPIIDGLDILGANEQADGILCTGTIMLTITHTLVRECRFGIHIAKRNRNIIIDTCHIYNNKIGVYLDDVDLHQINIVGSHISYNAAGGIKVERGGIRNIQICGNDIEYNYKDGGSDIWFIAGKHAIREGAISGNTIQALPDGAGDSGANIRIEGYAPATPNNVGFLSISANHIANNKAANIYIEHGRGIAIQGNTLQGAERNIIIKNSISIVCNNNILDDNPDYRVNKPKGNISGILLEDVDYGTLQGNILTRPHGGSKERGGAIEARRCAFLNISGCTIIGPAYRGIWLEDTRDSIVAGCLVAPGEGVESMLEAITEAGDCRGNTIATNRIRPADPVDPADRV